MLLQLVESGVFSLAGDQSHEALPLLVALAAGLHLTLPQILLCLGELLHFQVDQNHIIPHLIHEQLLLIILLLKLRAFMSDFVLFLFHEVELLDGYTVLELLEGLFVAMEVE
jgi:hypothetical protein